MKNKELKIITKIILIAGIILCGIAQILPWSRLELNIFEISENVPSFLSGLNMNFYHWGGWQISPILPGIQEWYLTPTDFSGMFTSPEIYGFAFGTLFLYFIIPLAFISLIMGIVAYRKIDLSFSKNSLHAAISSFASIIFFSIYMQLTIIHNLFNLEKEDGLSANFYWLPGFYLMIISFILYLISYFIIYKKNKNKIGEQIEKKKIGEKKSTKEKIKRGNK